MNGFETILPFLKPIEHLILDESISEVMVNGPDRVFVEKAGFVEEVHGISIGEKSLMVAVKNIAVIKGLLSRKCIVDFGKSGDCGSHGRPEPKYNDARFRARSAFQSIGPKIIRPF